MPIKGVTENTRLPRLGKIHLGIKVPAAAGKAEYPRAVDYFVCPDAVKRVYGEQPKALEIVFPSEETDLWASQFYKCYSKIRLLCKGDGERAWSLVDAKTGEIASRTAMDVVMKEVRCDAELCPIFIEGNCKPIMCLQFMLPAVDGLGIWQIDTGSWNSIRNINDGIAFVRGLAGRISLIPLMLEIGPKEVTVRTKDAMSRKSIYCMTLNTKLKLAEIVRLRATPMLTAGRVVPDTPPDEGAPEDLFSEELLERMDQPVVTPVLEPPKKAEPPKKVEPPKAEPKKVAEKRGGAEEAHAAHNREVAGSNPAPATTSAEVTWPEPEKAVADPTEFFKNCALLGYKDGTKALSYLGCKSTDEIISLEEAYESLAKLQGVSNWREVLKFPS